MFVKHAKVEITKVGYLKDLERDLRKDEVWAPTVESTLSKMASLRPIARYLDDFIYTRQRAISAFEHHGYNGNKDAFREAELMKGYPTFINTGFYKDHKNWDKKFAYGVNLDSRYHPNHFIEVISAVSKKMQPDSDEVVRNILSGKWGETSMGAEVQISICSLCGNRASRAEEFCDHIRFMKAAKLDGQTIFEFNEGLNFFDDSIITTEAAEREALITEVYSSDDLAKQAVKEPSYFDIVRTPHLDMKVCTNCKENFTHTCKGDGSCGKCAKTEKPIVIQSETSTQPTPNAMVSKGSDGDVNSKGASAVSVASHLTEGENKMPEKNLNKSAAESEKTSAPTVGKADQVTQQDAGDYNRSEDPTKAAAAEAKKASDAVSPLTVGKEDQVSQKKDEDYPHKSASKEANSMVARVLKSIGTSLIHMAEGEAPATVQVTIPVETVNEMKSVVEKALDQVEEKKEVVESMKKKISAKVARTALPSLKAKAQKELAAVEAALKVISEEAAGLEEIEKDLGAPEGMGSADPVEVKQDIMKAIDTAETNIDKAFEELGVPSEKAPEEGVAPGPEVKEAKSDEDKAAKEKAEKKEEKDKKEASQKTAEELAAPAGKQEAGNPQLLIDRGDYNKSTDPVKAQDSANKSGDTGTRSDIDKQRDAGFALPTEQIKQRELKLASNRYYLGLREAGYKHVEAAAKVKAFQTEFAPKLAAAPTVEDLKKEIVDVVSDKLVDEILEKRPETPGAAPEVAAPEMPTPSEESKEMFGQPPVAVTSAKDSKVAKKVEAQGDPKSEETPGPKASGEMPADPADPGWDLFPEDKVSDAAGKANKEQESALREEMKGVFVPESAGSEAKFRSSGDPLKTKSDQAPDLFDEEHQKMAEALEMAQAEVNAGLIEESQMESESKRLFFMSPTELQATAAMVERVKKVASFKHPEAQDPTVLKQAVSMAGAGSGIEGHLFDD